jgi:hypothetical protein
MTEIFFSPRVVTFQDGRQKIVYTVMEREAAYRQGAVETGFAGGRTK